MLDAQHVIGVINKFFFFYYSYDGKNFRVQKKSLKARRIVNSCDRGQVLVANNCGKSKPQVTFKLSR